MKIIISNGSSIPLYEQIKTAIKDNIMDGTLLNDEQLPSIRVLSKEIGVSILTVKKAYEQLEQEGFLVVRQGLGSFVSSNKKELKNEENRKNMEEKLVEGIKLAKSLDITLEELQELIEYLYGEDYGK